MFVLSHQSALAFYRNPSSIELLGTGAVPLSKIEPCEAPAPAQAIAIASRLNLSFPIHFLVDAPCGRRASRTCVCHVFQGDLPARSLIPLGDGVAISSPCMLFLELASRSDFLNALMIGEELAGQYAVDPTRPEGIVRVPKRLEVEELLRFLEACEGAYGASKAADAAVRILGNAMSPKEAEIGQLLSLPRRRGGRGVPDIELNMPIELPEPLRAVAGRRRLVVDVYSAALMRVSEYDSDSFHLDRTAHENDERKRNVLGQMGLDVVVITNGQLKDWKSIDAILRDSEMSWKPRISPASEAIRTKQHDLWRKLIFGIRRGGKTFLPRDLA